MVKGGVALILRVGDDARTTKDLDLARYNYLDAANDDIMALESTDLNDYFSFSVSQMPPLDLLNQGVVARFRIQAQVDGRRFEHVSIDVGFDSTLEHKPDHLTHRSMLEFAGPPAVEIPAVPLERHLAEKLHAYTRTYAGTRVNTRVRDIIDIILIGSAADIRAGRFRKAIASTFVDRSVQPVPTRLPLPQSSWYSQYQQLAAAVSIDQDLRVAHTRAAAFLDPILQGTADDRDIWDAEAWAWRHVDHD